MWQLQIYLVFWIFLFASAQYARLTDENYAVHFPEESTTLSQEILGIDDRFQALSFSGDYAMMSWVQIQEIPSSTWTSVWKIEHGDSFVDWNGTPATWYHRAGTYAWQVATSEKEDYIIQKNVSSGFPRWVYVSIVACGSNKYIRGCLREWQNTLSCAETSITGTVIPFSTTSTVKLGLATDFGTYPCPKMQILDLRYYSGTCLSDSAIDAVVDATSACHSACSGCWGPGNYSCNQFITLIDPQQGQTLDGQTNVQDVSYVSWDATDSFLMGLTFNSDDVAFTGWFYQYAKPANWTTLFRASTTNMNNWVTCRVPAMFYKDGFGYGYRHSHSGGQTVINTMDNSNRRRLDNSDPVGNWHFVVGSSCISGSTILYDCYGTLSGSMRWVVNTDSQSYNRWDVSGAAPKLWVGDSWTEGPNSLIKDVRYYYNTCLDEDQMAAIKSNLACKPLWAVCSDPDTCDTCITGYALYSGECRQCYYPCQTWVVERTTCTSCFSGYYLLGTTCVADWGSGYWAQAQDKTCQPCDACWQDCYGPTGSYCTVWDSGCYLVRESNSSDSTCQACDPCWSSCYGIYSNQCYTWNSGWYLQPEVDHTCKTTCLNSYLDDGVCQTGCQEQECPDSTNKKCQQCNEYFVDCSNASEWRCIDAYYLDDDGCNQCSSNCTECTNYRQCLSCEPGYVLDSQLWEACDEFEGYGGLRNPAGVDFDGICDPICGDGILKGDETCDDGNLDEFDGWDSKCQLEEDAKATIGFTSLQDDSYIFALNFDKPVEINEPLTLQVTLSAAIDYSLQIESNSQDDGFNTYQIQLTIGDAVPDETQVQFTIQTQILNSNGEPLKEMQFNLVLESKSSSESEPAIAKTTQTTVNSTVLSTMLFAVGTSAANSAVGASASASGGTSGTSGGSFSLNMTMVWGLIEACQIYAYMRFISVIDDEMLSNIFELLGFANGNFIPNLFAFFIEDDGYEPPQIFADGKLSTNYLLNAGDIIGAFFIDGMLLTIVYPLSRLLRNWAFIQKTRDDLMVPAPLRIANEGALDITLAVMLQLRYATSSTKYNLIGTSTCGFSILCYLLMMCAIFRNVILKSTKEMESDGWKQKWGGLYNGYKMDHLLPRSFQIFELVRRVLYVAALVFLTDYPQLQIWSLLSLQGLFISLCVMVRPFNTKAQNGIKIVCEAGILWVLGMLSLLMNDEVHDQHLDAITWVIATIIGIQVGGLAFYVIFVSVVSLSMTVITFVKTIVEKYKNHKVHPIDRNVTRVESLPTLPTPDYSKPIARFSTQNFQLVLKNMLDTTNANLERTQTTFADGEGLTVDKRPKFK